MPGLSGNLALSTSTLTNHVPLDSCSAKGILRSIFHFAFLKTVNVTRLLLVYAFLFKIYSLTVICEHGFGLFSPRFLLFFLVCFAVKSSIRTSAVYHRAQWAQALCPNPLRVARPRQVQGMCAVHEVSCMTPELTCSTSAR